MIIVLKIGSSSLHSGTSPLTKTFKSIAKQTSRLLDEGNKVLIVSSGAIAFGRSSSYLKRRKHEDIVTKQVLASLGQHKLMESWSRAFLDYGLQVGQVLVTNQELFGIDGSLPHIRDIFRGLFAMGVVPVVNENDAVAIDEIVQGDNDVLSAHISNLVNADELYILGTASAVYRDFPLNNNRLKTIDLDDLSSVALFSYDTDDPQATGGMKTKIDAARIFFSPTPKAGNRSMYIGSAVEIDIIERLKNGQSGTYFKGKKASNKSEKFN